MAGENETVKLATSFFVYKKCCKITQLALKSADSVKLIVAIVCRLEQDKRRAVTSRPRDGIAQLRLATALQTPFNVNYFGIGFPV